MRRARGFSYLLTLPGEDGGNELRIRVAAATKIGDNGLNVKRHPTVRDGQIVTVVFEKKPARGPERTWQPRAARIEGTDTADETISCEMSMAADHDASIGSGEQLPELLIGDARLDPWAVVGTG
jgi:hypothetical protein